MGIFAGQVMDDIGQGSICHGAFFREICQGGICYGAYWAEYQRAYEGIFSRKVFTTEVTGGYMPGRYLPGWSWGIFAREVMGDIYQIVIKNGGHEGGIFPRELFSMEPFLGNLPGGICHGAYWAECQRAYEGIFSREVFTTVVMGGYMPGRYLPGRSCGILARVVVVVVVSSPFLCDDVHPREGGIFARLMGDIPL